MNITCLRSHNSLLQESHSLSILPYCVLILTRSFWKFIFSSWDSGWAYQLILRVQTTILSACRFVITLFLVIQNIRILELEGKLEIILSTLQIYLVRSNDFSKITESSWAPDFCIVFATWQPKPGLTLGRSLGCQITQRKSLRKNPSVILLELTANSDMTQNLPTSGECVNNHWVRKKPFFVSQFKVIF